MRSLSLLMLIALLSACGWHLKGAINAPDDFNAIKITGASSKLYDELAAQLTANGINTDPQDNSYYTLVLGKETNEKRTAALGADAVVAEYEYYKAVTFELRNPANQLVGEPTTAELTRSVSYNANSVLSSSGEGSLVQTEMTRDLASQIIRRLSFSLQQSHGQTAP